MAIIYTGNKSTVKAKKKVGWKKAEEEYQAWLAKHGVTTSKKSSAKTKSGSKLLVCISTHQEDVVKQRMAAEKAARMQHQSQVILQPAPVKVHDPRVLYKDNADMLERELKARERKFATAPAYNKGGDMLVTPEMMKDIQAGGGRRRS